MLIVGVDPGKRTGVAWVKKVEGLAVPLRVLAYSESDFNRFLDNLPLQHQALDPEGEFTPIVVVEDFILRPKFDGQWTTLPTAEKIGAVKRVAYQLGWRIYKQQPSCLPTGCRYAKIPYKKGTHLKDELSALAHATYFAMNGGRRT